MGVVYVLDIYYGNKKGNKTEFEDFCLAPPIKESLPSKADKGRTSAPIGQAILFMVLFALGVINLSRIQAIL